MFRFQCDWCNQWLFNSEMWYCIECAILLCNKCMENEEAGVIYYPEGEDYQHCGFGMEKLEKHERQLLELMLDKNPNLQAPMMRIFKNNARVANKILEVANREGWTHGQLPPQVTNPYGHNVKWFKYLAKKSWGMNPTFKQ
jgi:hypothetical protein